MSLRQFIAKLIEYAQRLRGAVEVSDPTTPDTPVPPPSAAPPSLMLTTFLHNNLRETTLELLALPRDEYLSRLTALRRRGCNCAVVYFANQGDTKYGWQGLNPFLGGRWMGEISPEHWSRFDEYVRLAHGKGIWLIPCLVPDDSRSIHSAMERDQDCVRRLTEQLWTRYRHSVCGWMLCLEGNEYPNAAAAWVKAGQWLMDRDAPNVGAHSCKGSTWATNRFKGNCIYYQHKGTGSGNWNQTAASVATDVARLRRELGVKVFSLEVEKNGDLDLANAAIDAGAVGTGAWV